jgi:hypothetical protein
MPKIAKELSALEVRRIKTAGLHFVGGVPGLALQVFGDARSWVLRVAVAGTRREIGLGGFTSVNGLAEARRKAHEERERIRTGIDPVQARRSVRAALKAARLGGLRLNTPRSTSSAVTKRVGVRRSTLLSGKRRWRNTPSL